MSFRKGNDLIRDHADREQNPPLLSPFSNIKTTTRATPDMSAIGELDIKGHQQRFREFIDLP